MTKRKETCEKCKDFGPQGTKLDKFYNPEKFKVTKDHQEADCHLLAPRNLVVGPAGLQVVSMPAQTPRDYWCRHFVLAPKAKKPQKP